MNRAALVLLLAASTACVATIPPAPAAPIPAATPLPPLPTLQPCLLLNGEWRRPLSDGVAGAPDAEWHQVSASVLVPHASGPLLIDAAVGRALPDDYGAAPFWFRSALGDWSAVKPTVELLGAVGIAPDAITRVVSTHVHWDHVGGLRDLPAARALFWETDIDWALGLDGYVSSGVMRHQLDPVTSRIERFRMDGPAYEGFAASHDVLGDGTLIAVPLPGHTPGSTAFFLNSGDGRRWLFTGDATWTMEGVRRPAHRGWLASQLLDHDDEVLSGSIALLNALHRERPDIAIMPAHDMEALGKLPRCAPAPVVGP